MVAIKRYILIILAVVAGVCTATGQKRAVISGLETDAEYRELIEREEALVRSLDSLAGLADGLRETLRREAPENRAAHSAEILGLERESFRVRSLMAGVAGRINTIEQRWVLQNLHSELRDAAGGNNGNGGSDPDSGSGASIGIVGGGTGNDARDAAGRDGLEKSLDTEQAAELRLADEAEPEIPPLIERYAGNNERLRSLADEYRRIATRAGADSIKTDFDALAAENERLDEEIADRWEAIFDSKSYIYNLWADKENRTDMLSKWERSLENMRGEQAAWQGEGQEVGQAAGRGTGQAAGRGAGQREYVSEAIARYVLQKRVLLDHEMALAAEFGGSARVDSLRRALEELPTLASLEGMAALKLTERAFFDFADVGIGGSPYNASNPIPEVQVYPRGVIWRVLVGNFSAPQSPSVFRNAWPLAVGKGEDGRYRYFAGGFGADSLAGVAVERLRKAGFRNPSVVVWMDGTYIDPGLAEDGGLYSIEVSGIEEFPAEASERNIDIVKTAGGMTITPLDTEEALRLRLRLEALRDSLPEMTLKLTKISE